MDLFKTHLISIALLFLTASASAQTQDFYESHGENRLDPRDICGHLSRGDEKVRCYEKVAHDNPDSPDAHYFLAVAYVWAGDKKSTLKEYKILKEMHTGIEILLLDGIYHIQPEWFDKYYQEEAKHLEETWQKERDKPKPLVPLSSDEPLHRAVEKGNAKEVERLIGEGANVNKATSAAAFTPLHVAAQFGDEAMVYLLLEHGADLKARDGLGRSALHWAASSGNRNLINLFIDKGIPADTQEHSGETPLHTASVFAMRESIEALARRGANINARDRNGGTPLHAVFSTWAAGEPPSRRAAVIDTLVQYGADINAVDDYGRTALHHAVFSWVKDVIVIEKLLQHGANINAADKSGKTPMHYVAQERPEDARGQPDPIAAAELLIRHGADLNARDNHGETPLDRAIARDNKEMVKLLRQHLKK